MVDLLMRHSRSPKSPETIGGANWIRTTDSSNPGRVRSIRLSSATAQEIVERYQAGEKITELAGYYSIDRSTVMRQLRKAGVPKYAGWTDQVTEEARMLYEAGHSLADISQLIGWPPTTISRHLKAAGVELRPRGWTYS